jgi:hypothetical protein
MTKKTRRRIDAVLKAKIALMALWREGMASARAVDMMDNTVALPTCPQQQRRHSLWLHDKRNEERSSFHLRTRRERSHLAGPFHGAASGIMKYNEGLSEVEE